MEVKKPNIGLLLIVTGKYDVFLQPLIDTLASHFFTNYEVTIYLFWDKPVYRLLLPSRFSIICIPTEHRPFPFSTLYRYKYFVGASEKIHSDYIFYMDVDMLLVGDVSEEILPQENDGGLTATGHPGFWINGGSWCTNLGSTAYTPESQRIRYCAGGFQGGETKSYLNACKEMADNISIDESRGIIAEWHDEQHWTKYISIHKHKLLTPEYCMIPEIDVREKCGISNLTPRIIALTKDHKKIRE